MVDRVTKVTLTAQAAQYINEMQKAAKATTETANAAQKLQQQEKTFNAIGKAAMAVGTVAAVGVGLAVSKFAEFDKAMSGVQAATHESTESMSALRDAALEAGASTVFTASESARAIEELAKAGVSTADILGGGLKGSLDLAAAGELEVGAAAEIAASALTQFNLAGSDVPHVADVLAAGAGKAQGSVEDMSAALNQAGGVAAGMGISLEETVGSLSLFASAGYVGSDAGTSFRQMLLRLSNPTDEAKQVMDELGISVYDASGQFVGMQSVAGQLQNQMSTMSAETRDAALATIFGADAIRTARVLYTSGAEGVASWTSKVDDSGYAAETAALRMDNLAGDVEKLGGAFDTALIKSGAAANDALRGLTQGVTAMVDGFASAPQGVQGAALAIGAVTAAVGLAGGAFLLAVPKIAAFRAALATMSPATQRAATVLGAVGKAAGFLATLGVAVSILDKLAVSGDRAAISLGKVTEALNDGDLDATFATMTGSVKDFSEALELVEGSGFDAQMERMGEALGGNIGITGVVTEARAGFTKMGESLAQMVNEGKGTQAAQIFAEIARKADEQGISLAKVEALMPAYTDAIAVASGAQEEASVSSAAMSEGIEGVESAADSAKDSVESLADTIRGFGDSQLSVNEANRAVEESLDSFTESVAANGQTLDVTTEAGRANSAALDGIAQSYIEAAAATVENTGKQSDAIPVIEAGRQAVVDAGIAAGLSQEAAEKYADSLGLIPADVQTQVTLQSQAAMDAALRFAQVLRDMPSSKTVYLYTEEQRVLSGAPRGQIGAAYKDGGMIPHLSGGSPTWWRDGVVQGPGGPRDDRVAAMLSPGEFVVNAAQTARYSRELHDMNAGTYGGAGGVDMSPVVRQLQRVDQTLREVRDRTGTPVPVGAVQAATGSTSVFNTRNGRI
ncbi:phage tail tape measure protein [Agromyces cerinus]|uniref:Phage tail tape measure protein, TP901 family, core region n=1 Tax=Agromyces cerinus subsp. cerinus TaxID=232089 RepID=A0A1N6DQD6_9MICO|nr:phage tail tape measure protein [Agromyces cerinus]SIN72873.1 phage tail tape measure protein, TP901 family, core region [Agromyces cerinus subsp. cerinus]